MKQQSYRRFYLSDAFIDQYKGKQPDWGPLGYVTYKRTYSRSLGPSASEEYWQTIRRVTDGIFDTQKQHIVENGLGWDDARAQKTAKEMYDAMWNFKFLPAGRILWMMGTDYMRERTAAGLFNCGFCSTEQIRERGASIFEFIMDALMLGVGIGYDLRGADKLRIQKPRESNGSLVFVIPDSREGWVESLGLTLGGYFSGMPVPVFDYSLVRPAGEAIRGFGGTASGPGPLKDLHDSIIGLFSDREGEFVTSTDIVDIVNFIARCVVAGNTRRSATLALGNPSDTQFMTMKHDQEKLKAYRWASNNSVACTVGMDYSVAAENTALQGEPGYIWLDASRKFGRTGEPVSDSLVMGYNPCLAGDTLVYTADGRGNVPIKQLADEGKDIPVFCFDDNYKIAVRYMRNPRMTGYSKVYKVTFDDGNSLRVTGNHKFLTNNNEYVSASNLVIGDSIRTINKFEASIKDIFKSANSKSQDYLWINDGRCSTKAEHRYIAEFSMNALVGSGFVVHHKDRNAQNNSPDNLEIMTKEDHDALHGELMRGNNNPMVRAATEWSDEKWTDYRKKQSSGTSGSCNPNYSGVSNEDLVNHAVVLTKKLGRRFSVKEWESYAASNNIPTQFSKWRNDHLGGVVGLSKWAAASLGLDEFSNYDPRSVRKYLEWTREGYNCEFVDGHVKIVKSCEICGTKLALSYGRREVSMCLSCSNTTSNKNSEHIANRRAGMTRHNAISKINKRKSQLEIYTELKLTIGRKPKKHEWADRCKELGVSSEIGRKSSPFTSWKSLVESSADYNHRVVSVELAGEEAVYNGTVDEFHNFFVGGFESKTRGEKRKWFYVNNLQCGEQSLEDREMCLLIETFPCRHASLDEYLKTLKLAYLAAKSITLTKTHWPETNAKMLKNRRIGIGQSGIVQAFERHGRREMFRWCDAGYKYIQELDKKYSDWLCVPRSIKTTTVKPSGTTSLLPQVTPGIHYPESEYYIRRVRFADGDPLVSVLTKAGYAVEKDVYSPNTVVVEFPCYEKYFSRSKQDVSIWEQLENAAKYQQYWSDNSVSITVTFKASESHELKTALELYEDRLKTVSFLPLNTHGYVQAPYEAITKERYEEMVSLLKPLDLLNTTTETVEEKYCTNDTCAVGGP